VNNKMEGYGVYYDANGSRYEGNYMNDKREGQGVYYSVNGDRYEGNWVNNKMDGHGVEYFKDGTVKRKGDWKKGKFVE
jgi:hypothetical protein